MKVLVVNAFGLPPTSTASTSRGAPELTRRRHWRRGKDGEFVAFCRLVASALKQIDAVLGYKQPIPPQCHLVSATQLHFIITDTALHAQVVLDESARASCATFDSFDMVFIGSSGNSKKMLPWDASQMQLGILMHMCNLCGKPCFTVGCAALLEVYTLALRGSRIHPLNGARGSSISKLPQQPVFARSPCCFLDNETGDLYTYVEDEKKWTPTGNVGLRIVSKSGEPTSPRLAPPERRYASTRIEKLEEVVFDRDCIITVDVRFAAHPLLKNLGRQFVLTHLPEWVIQRYTNQMPFTVLGDSKSGPILIQHQLKTVLAVDISSPHHHVTVGQIMSNYVEYVSSLLLGGSGKRNTGNTPTRKIEAMLFGGGVPAPDLLCHPALAKQPIQSILPEGPYEIPPPPLELFTPRAEASLQQMRQTWAGDEDAPLVTMLTEGLKRLDNPKRVAAKNPASSRVTGLRISAVCRAANEDVPQRADDALTLNMSSPISPMSPIRPAAPAPSKEKMVVPGIVGWERLQGTPAAFKTVSQSQSQSARTTQSERSWLPVRHPETSRTSPQSNDQTFVAREKEDLGGGGDAGRASTPTLTPTPTPHERQLLPATLICSPVKKPLFSSYRRFAKMCANDAARDNEIGQTVYRDGEYLSAHERLIKEYVKAKARFVHPEKRGMVFGVISSQLPLREEGHVRPHGPYLEPPRNQGFAHMKPLDFEILRVEDRAKHLAGHWKKH